ncbi:MAG: flagellar basal body-associated FliL family protein, partial [Opitutales bacterium]|nr:flagellar basal body-associated FliL family protein [Opitutales bacterium]
SVHKATGMEGDHGGDNSSHGGEADSHGGGHGGGDSHGGAKADSHGGGHGGGDAHGGGGDAHGGGHGDTSGGGASGNTYEFDGILANLSGSSMNRYVRVSFIIEGSEPGFAGIMEQNRVKLIDATISVLSSLNSFDLQSAGVKNQVRSKLIAAFDAVLKKRMVEGLYFSEFVVQ